MPAYDFHCAKCALTFEVTRPMTARNDECCPACGRVAQRVFSPVGVAFKGSGFYNNDNRPQHKEESPAPAPACAAKSDTSPACAGCASAEKS